MTFRMIFYCFCGLILLSSCNEDFFSKEIDSNIETEEAVVFQLEYHLDRLINYAYVGESRAIFRDWDSESTPDGFIPVQSLILNNGIESMWGRENEDDLSDFYNYKFQRPPNIDLSQELKLSLLTDKFGEVEASQLAPPEVSIDSMYWDQAARYDPVLDEDLYRLNIEVKKNGAQFFIVSYEHYSLENQAGEFLYYDLEVAETRSDQFFYRTELYTRDQTSSNTVNIQVDFPEYAFRNGTADSFLIRARVYTCTEDHYLHKKSLYNYDLNQDNPFSEPVFIYSNLSKGIGLFSLINFGELEIIAPPIE